MDPQQGCGHQGTELCVPSRHLARCPPIPALHIQGTKALQSPWDDNHSLFQCRGPPPVPWGAEAQRFLKVRQNKTL